MEHEDLVILLKNSWKLYNEQSILSPALQFSANLKKIKNVAICWSVKKKEQDTKDLVGIETLLETSCTNFGFGFSSEEDKVSLYELEVKRRMIQLDREKEARKRSRLSGYFVGTTIHLSSTNMLTIGNLLILYRR